MSASAPRTSFWPVFLAWAVLFTPSLLVRPDGRAVALVLASAALLWPLTARRALPWAVAGLALLGAANIVHVSHFGYLVDEFFVSTALRTNVQETLEFSQSFSLLTALKVLVWLAVCVAMGRFLVQRAPAVRQQSRWSRGVGWAALVVWVVYGIFGATKHFSAQDYAHGVRYVYPLHAVRAVVSQHAMSEAAFYEPKVAANTLGTPVADTVVVVLGESASAQRWSLLGYSGAATNAPLQAIPHVRATTVLAHGLTTAETLPFLLTARTGQDSAQQQLPSYLDLARAAGYKVFAFNNSRYNSRREDFYVQVLRRSSHVYQQVGDGNYDEVLTPHLETALRDPAPRKLIVLHTYGSHPSLKERVPPAKATLADRYDNTIHYTSDLLAQWIGLTDTLSASTAMLLYSSDHGLVLPPCPGATTTGSSRSSVQVPLLVWNNQRLQDSAPQLASTIDQTTAQPMQFSNAELARLATLAVGGTPIPSPPLAIDGKPWSELEKLDACSQEYANDEFT